MKIAIHNNEGGFNIRWIEYCKKNNIEYTIVNAYDNDIVEKVKGCDAFMWHFNHADYRDMQFAKSLLTSLQKRGIKVFPDFDTCWHFDDKIAQKYLLEAIDAPLVPTYVFHTKKEALEWAEHATYPKVFKLKGGAGATNVKLAHTKKDATRFIKQCFGKGLSQYRFTDSFKEVYRKYKKGDLTYKSLIYEIYKGFIKKYPTEFDHYHGKECGYAYFQEFIPNNTYDIRVCVVGDKAFGLKRYTRENDFRASGSGNIAYSKAGIDERCVEIAFKVAKRLGTQSIALDFVFDKENTPLIVEISYGYTPAAYDVCEGYWTVDMQWHEGTNFDFCGWMIEDLFNDIKDK